MLAHPFALPAGASCGRPLTIHTAWRLAHLRGPLPQRAEDPSSLSVVASPDGSSDAAEGRSEPRLIVLDEDGVTLRGLVCANGSGTGFCIRP